MRLFVLLVLSLTVAGIPCGCASSGTSQQTGMRMGWFGAKSKKTDEAVADKKPTDEKKSKDEKVADTAKSPERPAEKVAETKSSPFKPSRDKPLETATASAEKDKKPETSTAKPVVDAKTESKGISWSPETVQLIGEELKDATPEERAEWHEHLKRVDPDVIPHILRARRMSRQVAETKPDSVKSGLEKTTDIKLANLESTIDRRVNVIQQDTPGTTERAAGSAPDRGFTIRERSDRAVQQVGFSNATGNNRVTQADYRTPADAPQRVDFASHQSPPKATNNDPVVLQGYVVDDGAAATDAARNTVPAIGGPSLPRASTATEPTGVPWPAVANKPPTNPNPSRTASSLPFGTGFVQNVVGLVPNRGNTVTPASNTAVAPQTTPPRNMGWGSELERTIAALEQEVATLKPTGTPEAQNDYLRKHLALRQMYLLTDRQERALTAIPGIDPADQEFWQQVFWGMSNYLDVQHIPRPQDRATQTISQMNTAIRRLQEQADLQIRNVAFCRQIQYFGNYERFPRDEFRPGQEVLLYAEVENFKSEPTADGQYRTLLRSTIEILSPNGDLRKQIDFAATEDLCRNYRRDYFHNYQFTIPDRIPLGPHTLKLTVFDELSGRMVSYTTNFNVQ